MLASKAFDHLLQQVQTSSLNYQIQISPFSAIISLKKSLIKDKAGVPQVSSISGWTSNHERTENLLATIAKLEEEVFILQKNYKDALNESDVAQQAFKALDSELKMKNETKPVIVETVSDAELKELREEVKTLHSRIEERDNNIKELEHTHKVAKEASNEIHKNLREMKIKVNKEKTEMLKEHKAEVKAWKKELGEAKKESIKLRKKFDKSVNDSSAESSSSIALTEHHQESPVLYNDCDSSVTCSICSVPIMDFKPKYFLGEPFNPACNDCDDSFEGDNTGPDPDGCKHTPVR